MDKDIESWDNEGGNPGGLFRMIDNLINEQKFDTPCNHSDRTEEMHSCPFAEEIWGDPSESCNCCDDCTYECAMDI